MVPWERGLAEVVREQSAAVSRAQVLADGASSSWIDRRLRSGRWQRLLPGVYVVHSGPVGWRTRAWAAVLYAGSGAALSHAAAAHVHGFGSAPRTLDVSVPAARQVTGQPGLRVHRRRPMPATVGRLAVVDRGPRVVDLIGLAGSDDRAVGIVTAAVRAGMRTSEVQEVLATRPRVRGRDLLVDLLGDAGAGVESALERRYRRIERAHGLPVAELQVRQRVGGCWIRADGIYQGLGVRVELDGELGHPGGRTDSDAWRDNAVAVERAEITLRYRWRHVTAMPCSTAHQVERALRSRGWQGNGRPCGPSCPVGAP